MDDQNKNLILATVLSFLVILTWFWLFPPEETVILPGAETTVAQIDGAVPLAQDDTAAIAAVPSEAPAPDVPRVTIETPALSVSLSLFGCRLSALGLSQYPESLD